MTCFWDGILQALDTSDFQVVGCNNRLNRRQLIDLLKNNNVEIFRITSAKKKTNNCLSLLEKSVINMERKMSIKNRLSCKYCKFHNTEHCK